MSIKDLISDIKQNGLLASMAQLEKLYQVAIENEQKLAESESRCAALAAENAGLKSAHQDAVDTIIHTANRTGVLYTEKTIQMSCKTPFTDAFLAEVRAISLEDFTDVMAESGHYDAANHATKHANKIRQEATSTNNINKQALRYGDNVLWFLNELAAYDASDIDGGEFDVYGEDRNGLEGCSTIDVTELAADAAKLIEAPQTEVK